MIKISEPNHPKNLQLMKPECLPFDVGFTKSNYIELVKVVEQIGGSRYTSDVASLINASVDEPDFYQFFMLYDFAIQHNKRTRYLLPEFGYSPYNFLLLINCLGVDKRELAKLLDWSFSKVSVNTAIRTSDHFMPMVGEQWVDFVNYFKCILKESDKHFGVKHDYNKLFYIAGDRANPLKMPTN